MGNIPSGFVWPCFVDMYGGIFHQLVISLSVHPAILTLLLQSELLPRLTKIKWS